MNDDYALKLFIDLLGYNEMHNALKLVLMRLIVLWLRSKKRAISILSEICKVAVERVELKGAPFAAAVAT